MKKIRIAVCRKDAPNLLGILQRFGLVEFTPISESLFKLGFSKQEKKAFEFNYVSSRLDFVVNFLSKFQKRSLLKKVFEDNRVPVSLIEIEKTAESFPFNDTVEKVVNLETQINQSEQKIQKLAEEERLLLEWQNLETSLNIDLKTEQTETIFIKIPPELRDDLESELKKSDIIFHLSPISPLNFSFTFFRDSKEQISRILSSLGIETVELPKRNGLPKEELKIIEKEREELKGVIEKAQNEAKKIGQEYLSKLKVLSDYFYWKKEKDSLLLDGVTTENVSVFEGWCPVSKIPFLNSEIEKEVKSFVLEEINPDQGEIAPVEIENKGIFKPFESITRLYGLPGAGNLDPTVFLSGFFFIFFGLSLTDVGYGLAVLIILSLIFFFYRVPKEFKPLLKLLMIGGLSSVIIGFLFGGYLGIDTKFLPSWLTQVQLFDPIASPLPVFYLSLGLGVCQVIVGMILKIITEAKNGNLWDGLFDQVPWLSLFLFLGLFLGGKFGVWPESPIFLILVVASLLAIVVASGRKQKSVVGKGFIGVLGLYNFINYFSDVLSYSRLLALGLATSALAFAVNLIALLARDMVPYVGLILMVIILIIGHLFNMVVNILGAFIHSARLQFVEFFGKFLTGTGRPFKPFRQEERNVVIVNQGQ